VCWGSGTTQTTVPVGTRHYLPSAELHAPETVEAGASYTVDLLNAHVMTSAGAVSAADAGIEYALDCGDGSGFSSFGPDFSRTCTGGSVGARTVQGTVRDRDGDERTYSAVVTITPAPDAPPPAPGTPLVVATGESNLTFDVSWADLSTTEARFELVRRERPEGGAWSGFTPVVVTGPNVVTHQDGPLTQSTSYQYRVRACNSAGCSAFAFSTQFTAGTAPAAPAAVVADAVASGVVDVTWDDIAAASTWEVQRRTREGSSWSKYERLGSVATNSYHDEDATVAMQQYRVRACNPLGCSAWELSNREVAEVEPQAAASLTATAVSGTLVTLDWTDSSSNETGFTVQRRVQSGGSWGLWTLFATMPANATGTTDTTVSPGTRYAYRVSAFNAIGSSGFTSAGAKTPD